MQLDHGERGVTLIEIMLATMIFFIGAVGLLPLVYSSLDGVANSSRLTSATSLAENKLADLLRRPYDHSELSIGNHAETYNLGPSGRPYSPSGEDTGAYGTLNGWFARSWEVEDGTVNGHGFKLITVTVEWQDLQANRARRVVVAGGKAEVQ